jgi:hypothetical protein
MKTTYATKRPMSWKQRLALAVNRAGRVTIECPAIADARKLATIRAKATAYAANNPAPRALYLVG